MKFEIPEIATPCEPMPSGPYTERVRRIIESTFPLDSSKVDFTAFQGVLPLVSWTPFQRPPFALSFFLCCHFRPNAFRFFHDMITRWLVPGKRMNALLQFAMDFTIPQWGEQKYMGGEVVLYVENEKELSILQKNLFIIKTEIRLGIESIYHANRILESKGLTADEKTVMLQERITALVKERPQDFDYDIYTEMQHFLIICSESFKKKHSYKHISRIICTLYLFRKTLTLANESFPERRYCSVKLIRAVLENDEPERRVLGIVVGMSFLRTHELFGDYHLYQAIASLLPDIVVVKGSFFAGVPRERGASAFYLEVEKEKGGFFSKEELQKLKHELPAELKNHIEERHHLLFVPQNEEEIFRHILSLSDQLKYVNDLPQVVITFHLQTEDSLEFLLIVLRVTKPGCFSIQELFQAAQPSFMDVTFDRIKIVGNLKKKHQKEATVFRIRVRKTPFLRLNHSVDLLNARQEIVAELTRVLGPFRDFNGGTISKERETLSHLRHLLGFKAKEQAFKLEEFFFSLNPVVMRSVLEPEPLKILFLMLLEANQEGLSEYQTYLCRIHEDSKYFYMVLTGMDASYQHSLAFVVKELNIPSPLLATCFIQSTDFPSYGVIMHQREPELVLHLRVTVENMMEQWSEKQLDFKKLNYL